MKKGLYITVLGGITAALLVWGCDFLLGPDAPVGAGDLVIGFGESGGISLASASLASAPTAEEQAALRYELVLTGPGGQIKMVSFSPGKIFNEQVALGEWRIEAEAYDPGNMLTGRGSAAVTVRAGVNEIRVRMEPVEAIVYSISLSQSGAYTFPAANEGYTTAPEAKTITVSNTGSQPTGPLTAALSGADPSSFTVSTPSISSIAVGETDAFTVVPKMGLTAGTHTETVTVSSSTYTGISANFTVSFTVNDTMSPASVSGLSGTPGNGQVTLTWTDPADADLDHVEITFTPGGTSPVSVLKGTQTKTITGLTNGTSYTFTVKAVDTAGNESGGETTTATPFVPVITVTGIVRLGTKGSFTLSGTVNPANATNKTITWSVKDTGTTGAGISGNSLSTSAVGTVVVTATIVNGTAIGTDYTQDFSIAINTVGSQTVRTISWKSVPFRYVPAGSFQRDGTSTNISVITNGYLMGGPK
jgi:hypothetical protein